MDTALFAYHLYTDVQYCHRTQYQMVVLSCMLSPGNQIGAFEPRRVVLPTHLYAVVFELLAAAFPKLPSSF